MGDHDRLGRGGEGPPSVPDIERRIHLYPLQIIGGGLLGILPLLALVGVLDQRPQVEVREAAAIEARVEYPARLRASRAAWVEVTVRNLSDEPLEEVRIVLPSGHLAGFGVTGILSHPSASGQVDRHRLEPGAHITMRVTVKAERIGRHRDTLRVVTGAGEELAIPLSTFILP